MKGSPKRDPDNDRTGLSRRDILRVCATAVTGTTATQAANPTTQPAPPNSRLRLSANKNIIPTNPLGKTGVKVTRLAIGAGYPSYDPRLLEHAYRNGIRYFDNAHGYGDGKQESILGKWAGPPDRRSELFVVTKAGVTTPELFYQKVIRALEHLRLDTIDMMCIHGIDDPSLPLDQSGQWRQLKDRLVREGKIRFMGFSTHAEMPARVQCVANAARSGWVDAAMVACDPLLLRTHEDLNRALDACTKAKVGLIAMKTTRGLGLKAAQRRGLPEGQAETETMAGFGKMGLSAFGAIHYGMWSDGRFTTVCSAMLNRRMIDENTRNARQFTRPLDRDQWKLLEDGMKKLARTTCPACDGSCRRAAGGETDFCSIARYLAYAEEDGNRDLARRLYRDLRPAHRRWRKSASRRASRACSARLDFESILPRTERLLG